MKKKILFSAYTLDIGGIETALVNLLNELIKKYDVTLVLEKKQGVFLRELNSNVNVIEYNPNQNKNVLIRKIINLLKRIKFIIKHKNKFDFAASFATYSKMGSFCARTASKNNALWGHLNYSELFKSKEEMKKFFEFVNYKKFKNIVFVSEEGAENFRKELNYQTQNLLVCNNLIDYKKIIELSNKKINVTKENIPTFLNVGRHEENQKRLTRIIKAAKILLDEKFEFRILMVGDGPDTENYKEMIKENDLEDKVIICGRTKNPYPYFKISDAVILTSEYEGYPVVFVEALVLKKPILTTNVSDAKKEINNKYGIVIKNNNPEEIARGMKKIITDNSKYKSKFNPEEFNNNILNKIEKLINGGSNA